MTWERFARLRIDPEAHAQHLGLARRESGKDVPGRLAQALRGGRIDRGDDAQVHPEEDSP